jgi:hypothetical protein
MYKKKTLRRMQPVTRRYARNLNSLQGILKRLQNLTEDIARLESDSHALLNATRQDNKHANLDAFMDDYLTGDGAPTPTPEDLLRQQQEANDGL